MKGFWPLFLGIFGMFAFSWAGLTVVPNMQIGHLDPQMDEEGSDVYPAPKSGMAERGGRVYVANGCGYCHSQQVRADYAATDIERKWGERRSAPRDYIFERPVVLGKIRLGPDLANIGKRAPADDVNAAPPGAGLAGSPPPGAPPTPAQPAPPGVPPPSGSGQPPSLTPQTANPAAASASSQDPAPAVGELPVYSAAWHHRHLYSPRSITPDSNMPAYRFLYDKRQISGERSSDALSLADEDAPEEGWEVVPTLDAKCLVAYLMSLDQSHPLNELKSGGAPATASPSPAPGASPAASPPSPGKEVK